MAKIPNYTEKQVTVNGEDITVYKIDPDVYGNPRYVVHFLPLGIRLADYGRIPGLTKYRAKWFGGGYVLQSYNIVMDLQYAIASVRKYYASHPILKGM